MGGQQWYKTQQWDPALIIAQIILIQSFFYLSLGLIFYCFSFTFDLTLNFRQFFDSKIMSFHNILGTTTVISFFLNGIILVFLFVPVVERARKCLDFTSTIYILHLFACTLYYGFPTNWVWWLTIGLLVIFQSALSEYLCLRRELEEIPVDTKKGNMVQQV